MLAVGYATGFLQLVRGFSPAPWRKSRINKWLDVVFHFYNCLLEIPAVPARWAEVGHDEAGSEAVAPENPSG
jgi:hypothetical protein